MDDKIIKNESGSLLVDYIESQPEVLQDGLLADFVTDAESFFLGDKVYIDRISADAGRAKAKAKNGKPDYLLPKGIIDVEFEAPKYSLSMPFNLDFGKNRRIIGSSATDEINKQAQLLIMVKNNLRLMLNRAKRGAMKQAADLYQYGKVKFSEDDKTLDDADFGFDAALFASPVNAQRWVNKDGTVNEKADPISDIQNRINLINEKSCVSQFDVIFDGTALKGFIGNPTVKTFADKNGINLSNFEFQERKPNGLAKVGSYFFGGDKVDIYTFSGSFTDDDGKAKKYLDDGRVIVKARYGSGGKYKVYFAGIEKTGTLPDELKNIVPNGELTIFGDNKAVDVYFYTKEEDDGVQLKMVSRPVVAAVSVNTHGAFLVKAE
ncbi:MAG: major capsid protein [Chitinivibrionia bacterium]|nr:major capsid protein [Chitinivibrionia bacterium]